MQTKTELNVTALDFIATTLEANTPLQGIGFNMECLMDNVDPLKDMTEHECGTVGCIAGWALLLKRIEEGKKINPDRILEENLSFVEAGNYLGLAQWQEDDLFYARGSDKPLERITTSDAAKVIRHLIATGEVNWSITN